MRDAVSPAAALMLRTHTAHDAHFLLVLGAEVAELLP